jgi:hypothetical protein
MNGIDPGAIARNLITYLGGAGGAELAAAALITVWLLVAIRAFHAHAGWITTVVVMTAWCSSWIMRTVIGWGGI